MEDIEEKSMLVKGYLMMFYEQQNAICKAKTMVEMKKSYEKCIEIIDKLISMGVE